MNEPLTVKVCVVAVIDIGECASIIGERPAGAHLYLPLVACNCGPMHPPPSHTASGVKNIQKFGNGHAQFVGNPGELDVVLSK